MEYKWNQLHALYIKNLFQRLNESRIRYFVLRNYERLPDENLGKDIDIVIEPGKYDICENILIDLSRLLDIRYYTVTQFDRMRCWYIMDIDKDFGIHIDIIENENYKGFEFYDFDYLYAKTYSYNGFIVLNKVMDTQMLLVQNLVAYKSLKEKYRKTISENYKKNKSEIDAEIVKFWGNNLGRKLIDCLNNDDFDSIVSMSKSLEKTARKRIFIRKPLVTIKNIIRFLSGKVYRIIWCPKKFWRFFAVEAPDGTGKTTFIDNLILELMKFYVSEDKRFCVHHFRPSILPNLGAAGEKMHVMKQDRDFDNPHRAKEANFCSSFMRMSYYWLDYIIGIPFLIRKEVQYERYTIFDRYIYDFLVDPSRSRIKLPYWLRASFVKAAQKPQIVFVLQAAPEIVYERKKELTLEEISSQMDNFKKLSEIGSEFVIVDANKPVGEMVKYATRVIFEKFMTRI